MFFSRKMSPSSNFWTNNNFCSFSKSDFRLKIIQAFWQSLFFLNNSTFIVKKLLKILFRSALCPTLFYFQKRNYNWFFNLIIFFTAHPLNWYKVQTEERYLILIEKYLNKGESAEILSTNSPLFRCPFYHVKRFSVYFLLIQKVPFSRFWS